MHHILQSIRTWIDGYLCDVGGTALHIASHTRALQVHRVTTNGDGGTALRPQHTRTVDIADDNFRRREHNTMVVMDILPLSQTSEYLMLNLLDLRFLSADLIKIFLYTIFEILEYRFPIRKCRIHILNLF